MCDTISRIDEPVIAFCINGSYADKANNEDVYKCTRGTWLVNWDRVAGARFAFGVFYGIVLEVFEIDGWFPAGTTKNSFPPAPGRFEFVGKVAPEKIRSRYVGKRLPNPLNGPFRYFNC